MLVPLGHCIILFFSLYFEAERAKSCCHANPHPPLLWKVPFAFHRVLAWRRHKNAESLGTKAPFWVQGRGELRRGQQCPLRGLRLYVYWNIMWGLLWGEVTSSLGMRNVMRRHVTECYCRWSRKPTQSSFSRLVDDLNCLWCGWLSNQPYNYDFDGDDLAPSSGAVKL